MFRHLPSLYPSVREIATTILSALATCCASNEVASKVSRAALGTVSMQKTIASRTVTMPHWPTPEITAHQLVHFRLACARGIVIRTPTVPRTLFVTNGVVSNLFLVVPELV